MKCDGSGEESSGSGKPGWQGTGQCRDVSRSGGRGEPGLGVRRRGEPGRDVSRIGGRCEPGLGFSGRDE